MKKVSLRNFQLKASDYLDRLPIILTRYGKSIAVIQSVDTKVESVNNSVESVTKDTRYGFCEGHFERGVNYTLKNIAYEPSDGDVEPAKWLCPDCIKKLEAHVKKEGGRIICNTS